MNEFPIIGMSPGNSYFKDEEIKYLLKKTVERYGRVAVMIADIPAISTYIALGYPENRARRDKAVPQGNLLRNRTERARTQLGYSDKEVKILDWATEIDKNPEYGVAFNKIRALYESNEKFAQDADSTTRKVLIASKKEISEIEKGVKIAVHYLLSEIAFLEWAHIFFKSDKVIYIYHKNWPIYEDYIAGKYDGLPKHYLDFLLLENPWETYRSVWGGEDVEGDDSATALKRVEKSGILRVAFTNYPPALIYDRERDIFSGIFYEILVSIAAKRGWQIRWSEETGYGVIVDGLENNRFDIFGSTVWPTPERKERAAFSLSLYTSHAYPWALSNFPYEERKNDPTLRIVVKENDISHSIATADFPHARLVYVPQLADPQELLEFVAAGKGDITFVEKFLAEEYMKQKGKLLVPVSNDPIRIYENTFIFNKDDTSLRDAFNAEILEMLKNGEIAALIKKYTGSENTFNLG
jgi:tRNA-dependent cyclodipeptide synthase